MKTILSIVSTIFLLVGVSVAQHGSPVPNDTVTGTTLNKLVKFNTTSSATSAIITATTDTKGAMGICGAGCGTTGSALIVTWGVANCIFDNATGANDYVQIASGTAGDCHDAGATVPTTGQIVGRVFGAGGAAGTYLVELNSEIDAPPATAPLTAIGSSDTITAAGTFATTISVPSTGLAVGSVIEILASGVYTTTATASPLFNMTINAGGTTAICSSGANANPAQSKTAGPWEIHCWLQIATLGAPGTALPSGTYGLANPNGGGVIGPEWMQAGPFNYTTNSAQTVSVQETATLVSGQSFTLQKLFVRVY